MFELLNNDQRLMGTKSYGDCIYGILSDIENAVALDADLISASGARKAWIDFNHRFYNVGVAESNMMGIASGLSMTGLIPYVHTFAAFATRRPYDQIYLSAAYAKNNIKICGSDSGYFIGINGGTHTTYEDMALMRLLPSVVVLEPCDYVQLEWTLREHANRFETSYTRVFRRPVRAVYKENSSFEIGKGNILIKGEHGYIIAMGPMVIEALEAAEELKKKGISVGVIDMFTLKPLDVELVVSICREVKWIVTAENHTIIGGLGSAVAEVIAENGLSTILRRVGCQDRFGQVGSISFLQSEYGLDRETLTSTILKLETLND